MERAHFGIPGSCLTLECIVKQATLISFSVMYNQQLPIDSHLDQSPENDYS